MGNLFTVIIPAFNASRYLPEALESVFEQGYPYYEVVIVDDGSTDATGSMADASAADRANVKVVHQENHGLLLARRRGLEEARGEYVVFLDSDDCLRHDALELLAVAIEATDADIISFQFTRDSSFAPSNEVGSLAPGFYDSARYIEVLEHACSGRFNSLCGKAMRLSCIDLDTNYGEYAGLMHGEDLLQLLPILDCCESLYQLNETLYFYRPNEGASTHEYKTSQLKDILRVNRRLREYSTRWSDACAASALVGETLQFIFLLKLSELSNIERGCRVRDFEEIRDAMRDEGTFDRVRQARLRVDHRLLIAAVECGWHGGSRVIIRFVELLKSFGFGG